MSRDPGLDFSFSGLKTALVYASATSGRGRRGAARADLAASFQTAVVEPADREARQGARRGRPGRRPWPALALGGGVAANSLLRERAGALCEERGVRLKLLPIELCTDNAAMIGAAAAHLEPLSRAELLALDAAATARSAA